MSKKHNRPIAECKWHEDEDGVYDTACGNKFQFIDSGPRENHFGFCPYCGGVLVTNLRGAQA